MPGSRPGSVALIASQLRSTSPASLDLAPSPKMCGWRRTSFWRQCSATSASEPAAALLEQQREEVDLEEHVAQLVEELGVVVAVRGGGELVGLLDGVGDDRALVLLAVPRALAPQAAGQLVEPRDAAATSVRRALALPGPSAARAAGRRRLGVGVGRFGRVLAVLRDVALAAVRLAPSTSCGSP